MNHTRDGVPRTTIHETLEGKHSITSLRAKAKAQGIRMLSSLIIVICYLK